MQHLVSLVLLSALLVGLLVLPDDARGGEKELRRNGGYMGLFLKESGGDITIERVHPKGMAEEVGFRAGDVIRAVNGRELPNGDALIRRLWSRRSFEVTVRRGKKEVVIKTSTQELDLLPKVGEKAHEFTLAAKDGEDKYALKTMLEKGKPVVLIFGSFT